MKKVIIYTLSSCPHSKMLKYFLRQNDVVFEERDINKKEFYDEVSLKSGEGTTPVVDIDGKIIEGFDKEAIKKELGI